MKSPFSSGLCLQQSVYRVDKARLFDHLEESWVNTELNVFIYILVGGLNYSQRYCVTGVSRVNESAWGKESTYLQAPFSE